MDSAKSAVHKQVLGNGLGYVRKARLFATKNPDFAGGRIVRYPWRMFRRLIGRLIAIVIA